MEGISPTNGGYIGAGLGSLKQATMGRDEFLKLLIQQLQNQDPLSPMESQDFAAQLAQFSSLEQLTNMSGMMEESLNVDLMLTQAINNTMATNFIGKNVSAVGDSITLTADDPVDLAFKLNGKAETVTVKIMDADGNVVKEIEMGALSSGKHFAEWDGTNKNGEAMPAGDYRFEVEALDANEEVVSAITLIMGIITGIQYDQGAAVFIVNGNEIPFNMVLEITSGDEGA
ncbi:MAG TPA: hypothetical protein ENH49_06805 [Candidatus Marinimicrobia bacterium]|nr:hypothetical protein [Candidatus Neomarinimicrobiota bacterium]